MGVQCQLSPRIHRTLKGYLCAIAPHRIHSGNKIAFITMFRTPTRHRTTEGAVDIKAERAVKKAMYSQKHVGLIIQAQEEAFSKLLAYITPIKAAVNDGKTKNSTKKNLAYITPTRKGTDGNMQTKKSTKILLAYITPTRNHTDNGIQTKSSTKNLKGVRKLAF